MISVLFIQKNSVYKSFDIDGWDAERDATKWPGGNAIIAHPPCRAWGRYSHKSKHTEEEKEYARWAIQQARKWGGIVEHPVTSKLWNEMKLPTGTQKDEYGGWTLNIDQFWWGHKCKKNTHLYIIGIDPKQIPEIPMRFENISTNVEKQSKLQRERTPYKLAEWLIETAKRINAITIITNTSNYVSN